jgi:hypothetical protein
MKHIVLALSAGLAAALTLPSSAHHSAAVLYLLDQQITVEGTVKRFELGNPHARIFFTVKAADGTSADWMAEGGSRTVLTRLGWTGEEVKPGDAIKIIGNPSRDGSNVVHWQRLVLPNGSELWGEDIPEESALEELRRRRR